MYFFILLFILKTALSILTLSLNFKVTLLFEIVFTVSATADVLSASGENYFFVWEKFEHKAVMVQRKVNSHIRFQWIDDEGTDAYFESRIEKEAITGELTLIVTDYAIPSDKDDTVLLWNKQIEQLKRKIGL